MAALRMHLAARALAGASCLLPLAAHAERTQACPCPHRCLRHCQVPVPVHNEGCCSGPRGRGRPHAATGARRCALQCWPPGGRGCVKACVRNAKTQNPCACCCVLTRAPARTRAVLGDARRGVPLHSQHHDAARGHRSAQGAAPGGRCATAHGCARPGAAHARAWHNRQRLRAPRCCAWLVRRHARARRCRHSATLEGLAWAAPAGVGVCCPPRPAPACHDSFASRTAPNMACAMACGSPWVSLLWGPTSR